MDPSDLMHIYKDIFTKKLLLITGKGGIGKSLIAAALGQFLADAGKNVLIVQNASLDQISPLFGLAPGYDDAVRVQAGLDVLNIDAVANFRDYIVEHLGQKRLYNTVFSNRTVKSLINAMPGWADVMLLGRLLFECELRPRHDYVIFDGPASGHFLNLMTTPDSVLSMAFGGPLAKETQRVKDFLSDQSKCTMLYVGVPEELVVSECLDFLPRLLKVSPVSVGGVIMNRTPTPIRLGNSPDSQLMPAERYALQHSNASDEALAMLATDLSNEKGQLDSIPMWALADLGFIKEPLPAGFGRQFLTPLRRITRSGVSP